MFIYLVSILLLNEFIRNSKIALQIISVLCPKIFMQHIFFNYPIFINASSFTWCSFSYLKNPNTLEFLHWNIPSSLSGFNTRLKGKVYMFILDCISRRNESNRMITLKILCEVLIQSNFRMEKRCLGGMGNFYVVTYCLSK